jgi:hypothetical protein
MAQVYRVSWKKSFYRAAIFINIALLVPMLAMSYKKIQEDGLIELPEVLTHLTWGAAILTASTGFALLITGSFLLYQATLTSDHLAGRSYWGRKIRIRLQEISRISYLTHQGIHLIIVHSKTNQKVYLYRDTDNLSELIGILSQYLPPEEVLPDWLQEFDKRKKQAVPSPLQINPEKDHVRSKGITLEIPDQRRTIKNPTHAEAMGAIVALNWTSGNKGGVELHREPDQWLHIYATPLEKFHLEYRESGIIKESKDFVERPTTLKIAESYMDNTPDWRKRIAWVADTNK